MTKLPLITIVITSFNYGNFIGKAIGSALNQTYPNIELIIIDDGSTDKTEAIVANFLKHENVHYVKQKNSGANVSRNRGIELAKGEYLFLLDADNWIDDNHIEGLYKEITRENADIIYTNLEKFGTEEGLVDVPSFDIDLLKVTNLIDTASLVKKTSIGKDRFDKWLNRRSSQDWDFFLGLALKGLKISKAPRSLKLHYRIHEKQLGNSFKTKEKIQNYIEVYKYITTKYSRLFPTEFTNQIRWTNQLVMDFSSIRINLLEIDENNKILEAIISQKEAEINMLINSKSFRIGKIITAPWRYARTIAKR